MGKDRFEMLDGTKKLTKVLLKILLMVIVIGFISKSNFSKSKILASILPNIGGHSIFANSEVTLPGSSTPLDFSSPDGAVNSAQDLLGEIEALMNFGVW